MRPHALAVEIVDRGIEDRARERFAPTNHLDHAFLDATQAVERIPCVLGKPVDVAPGSALDDPRR